MDELTIRRATELADYFTAFDLVRELAFFEKLTPPEEAAKGRFIADGYERNPPRFEVWLAEVSEKSVGYILIFETYSTFLCRPTLYLEDLFVLPEFRRQGIGAELLEFCVKLARERGCGRMEWTCLDWNVRAQEVYEGMGAVKMSEWMLYRLTGDTLNDE